MADKRMCFSSIELLHLLHYTYLYNGQLFLSGMSLFVENGTATMQVQTENILYKTDFTMNIGVREKYMITWSSSQGLLVFVGSDVCHLLLYFFHLFIKICCGLALHTC